MEQRIVVPYPRGKTPNDFAGLHGRTYLQIRGLPSLRKP